MVTVPHEMVGLERMLNYRGVQLQRFRCIMSLMLLYICCRKSLQSSVDKDGKDKDTSFANREEEQVSYELCVLNPPQPHSLRCWNMH